MKSTTISRFFCSVALAFAMIQTAKAELVAYDPFLSGGNRGAGEYTTGTDMRTMGAAALGWVGTSGVDGFGISHTGSTSNFQADGSSNQDSPAVSYEQGGQMQWLGTTSTSPFLRQLNRQLNPVPSSSEWWFSIMVNRIEWSDTASSSYIVGGFTTDQNGTNGLQVGYSNGNGDGAPDLVLRSGGTLTNLLADAPQNDTQYVLVKLDLNTSGNDTVSVWVDPLSVSPLGAADVVITDQNISDSLSPFTYSRYESPQDSGHIKFDEIRLATDLNSITGIPEPTSMVLCGIGMIAMGCKRRR